MWKNNEVLGDGKLLAVEQAVVVETAPTRRAVARTHTRRYLPLTNYTDNLRRLGFDTAEFDHEGSNRLVDAIVAWGDPATITRRVQEHRDAGADHVCLQVISQDSRAPPTQAWKDLAQSSAGRHERRPFAT